ncbi:MAG: hypothetical protein DSZ05_06665 [Sulfurospirillum sp.]|nr:MAG: hypothetical protein DSZ05_06665 [Sulfurospirillum sp.]
MSRILLIFSVWAVLLSAGTENFDFSHMFTLKKDQIAEVEIKKDYPRTFAHEGILRFRWTLYHNKALVLLVDYEGFQTQYILETRYGKNVVKLFLTGDYPRIDKRPFVLLRFDSFDLKQKRAKLLTEFADPEKRLEIKIKKPEKQR